MKSLITFTIMAIIGWCLLLAAYEPREDKGVVVTKPLSQSTDTVARPVILHRMKPVNPLVDLFADDGQPVNQGIRRREALAAARDNNLPVARPYRSAYAAN